MDFGQDDPDGMIASILMRMQAPKGSPAAIVEERYAPLMEAMGRGDTGTIDMSEGPMDLTPDYMHDFLARMTRPEGIDAFMESAPLSENIEDRRSETIMDAIKRYMQAEIPDDATMGETFQPTPSEQLPVPNFDYNKRSR
jgi:hypothetical protein